MTTLPIVSDKDENLLWLHLTCGYPQWGTDDKPEWCNVCSFRTDAWYLLHADLPHPVARDRAPLMPDVPALAAALRLAFGDEEMRVMLDVVRPLAEATEGWRPWERLSTALLTAVGER